MTNNQLPVTNNKLQQGFSKKILVTGGAGFIGSHVVDAYVAAGYDVVVIDNLSTGKKENYNSKAKYYKVDICSDEACEIVKKEKPEIINHHAAQIDVRKSVANPSGDIDINVKALVNLIETAKNNGLKKIILASTGGAIYGEQVEFPATENHPTNPISPYGINKLACEKYLHYYHTQYQIPYVALRYANVYGPRQNSQGEAGVVAIFISKMLNNEQPIINGDGNQTRDYVYVDDVVKANMLALREGVGGAYNVGTGVEASVNDLFRIIKEITTSICDEKHKESLPGEQMRSSLSAERFEKELNWKMETDLNAGLNKTIEWMKI